MLGFANMNLLHESCVTDHQMDQSTRRDHVVQVQEQIDDITLQAVRIGKTSIDCRNRLQNMMIILSVDQVFVSTSTL